MKRSGWVVTTLSLVMVASAPLRRCDGCAARRGMDRGGHGDLGAGDEHHGRERRIDGAGDLRLRQPRAGGGRPRRQRHRAVLDHHADDRSDVDLSYVFTGFHAFFQVRVQLEAFVSNNDGTVTIPLVNAGPVDCCTAPSAGFSYTGDVSLSVAAGDTYGFRIAGSNGDLNSRLSGRLIVDALGGLGSTVKVVNGYSQARTDGGSGLTGPTFATTRALLTDASNFGGPGATFGTDLVLGGGVDTVSVTSLLGTDIFVTGSVASSTYTPARAAGAPGLRRTRRHPRRHHERPVALDGRGVRARAVLGRDRCEHVRVVAARDRRRALRVGARVRIRLRRVASSPASGARPQRSPRTRSATSRWPRSAPGRPGWARACSCSSVTSNCLPPAQSTTSR